MERGITFQVSGGIERLTEQDHADFARLFEKIGFREVKIFGTALDGPGGERETVFEMTGPEADASVRNPQVRARAPGSLLEVLDFMDREKMLDLLYAGYTKEAELKEREELVEFYATKSVKEHESSSDDELSGTLASMKLAGLVDYE
jgi:hypothetical protein